MLKLTLACLCLPALLALSLIAPASAQTPKTFALYAGPATPITHRAPVEFGDGDFGNFGLSLGTHYQLNHGTYLIAEASLLQDAPLLHRTGRERLLANRLWFTPALGIGKTAHIGRWQLRTAAYLGVRILAGQGFSSSTGAAMRWGAYPVNLGMVAPQSSQTSSFASTTPAMLAPQVGAGAAYRLAKRLHLYGELRLGYDIGMYDPNVRAKITYYDPTQTATAVVQYEAETRYRQGSVSSLFAFLHIGILIPLGKVGASADYVR